MSKPDVTDEEHAAVTALISKTIAGSRFPLTPLSCRSSSAY
jgi:hypothetical protein